jgi:hypothetical protein
VNVIKFIAVHLEEVLERDKEWFISEQLITRGRLAVRDLLYKLDVREEFILLLASSRRGFAQNGLQLLSLLL